MNIKINQFIYLLIYIDVNLPAAIAFTFLYSYLTNIMSNANVFYTILTTFLTFFAAFGTIIYPNIHYLHPIASANWLTAHLPLFMKPLISIFRNWTFSLFYVMAELWGSVIISLLFWGFANQV